MHMIEISFIYLTSQEKAALFRETFVSNPERDRAGTADTATCWTRFVSVVDFLLRSGASCADDDRVQWSRCPGAHKFAVRDQAGDGRGA
jgi:hypothetical protein